MIMLIMIRTKLFVYFHVYSLTYLLFIVEGIRINNSAISYFILAGILVQPFMFNPLSKIGFKMFRFFAFVLL